MAPASPVRLALPMACLLTPAWGLLPACTPYPQTNKESLRRLSPCTSPGPDLPEPPDLPTPRGALAEPSSSPEKACLWPPHWLRGEGCASWLHAITWVTAAPQLRPCTPPRAPGAD